MKKIIARENNGGRELIFPGKDVETMKLSEIKKLIAKKLDVSIDHILLCDRMGEEIKYENGDGFIEKAFGQGIVWYKNQVTIKIPSNVLKSVNLDKEADHSVSQIDKNNIQNTDIELREEIDLW